MGITEVIVILFIFIAVFIAISLVTYLIKMLKKITPPKYSPRTSTSEDEYKLKGNKSKNFIAEDINGEMVQLRDLLTDHIILIFLDSSCSHCNTNLSIFMNEIPKYENINFSLVFSNLQKTDMQKYYELYDDTKILFVSDEDLVSFQISSFPFYVFIDQSFVIQGATSIPYWIIEQFAPQKTA